MSFISYAQTLEDVMLYRALKHVQHGFYIDVGALYPDVCSVTKAFYDRGWCGINIEPIPEYFRSIEAQRPKDINLNVAISNKRGNLTLNEIVDIPGDTTANKTNADKHIIQGHEVRTIEVPCSTLDLICEENQVETVHFLKIDVEGLEKEVLEGFSFRKVRPWIVVIEANEPNSTKDISSQWESLILNNNYECVYYDGLNRFYLAAEHRDLQIHFRVPPNVFDQYVPYTLIFVQQELNNERTQKELLAKQLTYEAANFKQELSNTFDQKNLLTKQLAHVRDQKELLAKQLMDEAANFKQELADTFDQKNLLTKHLAYERDQKELLAKQLADEKACLEQISRSFSWRFTAPLRAGKNGTAKLIRKILNVIKNLIKVVLRIFLRFKLLVRIGGWVLKSQPKLRTKIGALGTQSYGKTIPSKHELVENKSEIFDNLPESARSIYLALKDAYNKKQNNNRKI